MKLGIFTDLRFTSLKTPTGVTKHIVQMVRGLYETEGIEVVVLAAKDQLTTSGNIPQNNELSYLEARRLPFNWHFIYWATFFFNTPLFDKYTQDLDLVYSPKNDYLPLSQTRYAVTFHGAHELDLDYPNSRGWLAYLNSMRSRKRYEQMLSQANIVFTVSEFLSKKTVEIFRMEPSKLKVIGNGVEDIFFKKGEKREYQPKGPFLAVGGLNYLDGGNRIIEFANELYKVNKSREIWVAGNQHDSSLLDIARKLDNIKILGYQTNVQLADTMSKSSALLYFTHYETFGIAAAEAIAVGLPVVTTRTTAVPEILGEAGIYIDPQNIFNSVMLQLEKEDINDKISIGLEVSKRYHWSSCVQRLVQEFRNLI